MDNSGKTDTYMGYMDILLPKLLRQALRKSPHSKLTRCKGAGYNAASNGRRCTCEDEGASRSSAFLELIVIFEREYRATGEGKGRCDAHLEAILDVLRSDFEERFPNGTSDIEYGGADGIFRLGELCMNGDPCRCYIFVRIRRDSERFGLFSGRDGLLFKLAVNDQ